MEALFLVLFGFSVAGAAWLLQRVSAWPFVMGDIRQFDMTVPNEPGSDGQLTFQVHYTYEVDGARYDGFRIAGGHSLNLLPPGEQDMLPRRFQAGQKVPVYYHPRAPFEATLIPIPRVHRYFGPSQVFIAVLLLVALGVLAFAFRAYLNGV